MTFKKISSEHPDLEHYHFTKNGFSCKIFPHLGGSIQELMIDGIVIIKEIRADSGGIENYKSFYNSAVLFPYPNRVAYGQYSFEGEDFQLSLNDPAFQNSIHGLVSDQTFNVSEVTHDHITLRYEHLESPGFPFPFELMIRYEFSNNGLDLNVKATNTGVKPFPFGMGWHPYFQLEDYQDCSFHISADTLYKVNDKMIPVDSEVYSEEKITLNNASLDTAYKLSKTEVILSSPKYELSMKMPESSFLQLYTPADRKSVAMEPMSCIANAFNNGIGLKRLEPGTSCSWEISLQFSKKD